MGDTEIGWTHRPGTRGRTWNPIRGCSRVSAGCQRCYAEQQAARIVRMGKGKPTAYDGLVRVTSGGEARWTGEVRLITEHLADPLHSREPCTFFVASMSDPFHDGFSDYDIDSIFAVMALADQHVYQLLTKRSQRMHSYISDPARPFKVLRAIDRFEVNRAMEGVSEEWRPVPSCPVYDVSNFGNVRRGGRLLALVNCGKGYLQVALCTNGKPRGTLVHRIVLEAFDRPPREGEDSAHRNGDRGDNRLANLRWATRDENMQDAARQGTAGVWMKSRATLTPDEVADVRAARQRGEKLASIATRFDIAKQQVSAIATGKIFKPAPLAWPLKQLWLGVSVENQEAADERIPDLLRTPAVVRFLSCEPLLGPLDLRHVQHNREFEVDALTGDHGVVRPLAGRGPHISWVITGAESGPGARLCDVAWLRSLRDQCSAAGVPFFLKQAVEHATSRAVYPSKLADRVVTEVITAGVGSKRKSGGLIDLPYLDGVQHAAFPEAT